jgi:hypothetical protein
MTVFANGYSFERSIGARPPRGMPDHGVSQMPLRIRRLLSYAIQ